MLFIYRVLPIGGIETFFVRMAKERARLGLTTSILLLSEPKDSNPELLAEMKKFAQVLFPKDIFLNIPYFSQLCPLLAPVKKNDLRLLLKKVDQIHVFDGMHALLGYHLAAMLNKNLPVTVGFYHYIKYLWGGDNVAWHEKVNRQFIFEYLPDKSLLFFSEGSRQLYTKHKNMSFHNANTFSLGVVDKKEVVLTSEINTPLRIVAIGRLVEFKTYNFYMINVVKNLIDKGIDIRFDIYGDGPDKQGLQGKIKLLGMHNYVRLKGTLDYSKFDKTVATYDLFIGSGTAIVQASALGLPSIVGVENVIQPKTYGYFCNVYQYQYTRKGLDLPLVSVEGLISEYVEMASDSRIKLKKQHVACIENFTNQSCQKSMDKLKNIIMPAELFKFNRYLYMLSYVFDMINRRLNKKHPRVTQFEDFRNLNEND